MEIIKAILALITSFFQRSTIQTTKEVKLADAETSATIETIRANENATAVQAQQKAGQSVQELAQQQAEERKQANSTPLSKRINDQFGSDQ